MANEVSLAAFLEATGREPADVYGPGWTAVRRRAGKLPGAAPDGEEDLSEKLEHILHIDERERLELYRDVLAGERACPGGTLDAKRILMLGYQLHGDIHDTFDHEEVLRRFSKFPEVKREACELCDALLARAHPGSTPLLA